MKFKIIDKAKVPDYKDCYIIEVTAMFGDADGYESFELGPFKNDEQYLKYLEEVVNVCRDMENAYPNGRGGGDNYQGNDPDEEGYVAGFERWFAGMFKGLDKNDPRRKLGGNWPHCPDGYGDQASFDNFEVFYYDKNGIKYNVKVVG